MSDQIADRRAKLEKIRALGVDPYGGRFAGTTPHAQIRAAAERLNIGVGQILEPDHRSADGTPARFRAAGRIVLYRDIGSLIFLTVRDRTGDLQYGLSKKMVLAAESAPAASESASSNDTAADRLFPNPPTTWKLAKLLDLGDLVGAEGLLGRTRTGELTLWVERLALLAKALRPPPEKRLGLIDVEQRYRRRYVDLFSNPPSRQVFLQRACIIEYIRRLLHERGFVEVETPVLQPIYGGAAARPFTTHHNALDMDLYLRISPELYLKRCLVGGLERVYEIARCFRNEGISPRHNPEFTMLELYQAWADREDMMQITEQIVAGAAREVLGTTKVRWGDIEIDYTPPFPRRRYADLFAEHVGTPMDDIAAVRARARELQAAGRLACDESRLDDAVVVNEVFEACVERHLVNSTFVLDYPAALCPLTRRDPHNPDVALRFELYIAGMEIANAYTELNDPDVQRRTLAQRLRGQEEETMAVMDEDFIEALEYGMPPAGGLGIGLDRLVMLLTNSRSIRDVILFPLQRPQPGRS